MTRGWIATVLLVVLVPFAAACSKDKKDGGDAGVDAAADAAVAVAVPDAAAVAVVDAAVEAAAPLATASPVATPVKPAKPAAPDPPICAKARAARGRSSPAAAGLEAQCRAAGGTP